MLGNIFARLRQNVFIEDIIFRQELDLPVQMERMQKNTNQY